MKDKSLSIQDVKNLLHEGLSISYLKISNDQLKHSNHKTYDGGLHLIATIVSNDFKGMSLLNRHRQVYEILKMYMRNGIHALSMDTLTTEEYSKKDAKV
tara:strand:+ start:302 stop:598 length:297 start_codon:yes stop_codon:yes gene_type:complete